MHVRSISEQEAKHEERTGKRPKNAKIKFQNHSQTCELRLRQIAFVILLRSSTFLAHHYLLTCSASAATNQRARSGRLIKQQQLAERGRFQVSGAETTCQEQRMPRQVGRAVNGS